MNGVERIATERKRQIEEEWWTEKGDDVYTKGELMRAAVCYALATNYRPLFFDTLWPFDKKWWKPSPDNRIRELEKAGALIAAEIDRLRRLCDIP